MCDRLETVGATTTFLSNSGATTIDYVTPLSHNFLGSLIDMGTNKKRNGKISQKSLIRVIVVTLYSSIPEALILSADCTKTILEVYGNLIHSLQYFLIYKNPIRHHIPVYNSESWIQGLSWQKKI